MGSLGMMAAEPAGPDGDMKTESGTWAATAPPEWQG